MGEERQMKRIDDVCIPLDTIKEWHKLLEEWHHEDPAYKSMVESLTKAYLKSTLEDIIKTNEEPN
jgi:hypothetical protein